MTDDHHLLEIEAYMSRRWPQAKRLTAYVRNLWDDYRQIDVGDRDQVVRQLTDDDDEHFWQRLWEMQLGSHLFRLGYDVRSPKERPDFRVEVDGRTTWIEAISPAPRRIPAAWLGFPSDGAGTTYETPDSEMLLCWTGAFRKKRLQFDKYLAKKTTRAADACVIAINGGQLSNFWQTPYGISQLPWCLEVVFPIGPMQAHFFPGREDVKWGHATRENVTNHNGKPVSLHPFMTPECSGISALVTCVTGCSPDLSLPLYVAHNPFADVPLPLGVFGDAAEEWLAVPTDQESGEFFLRRER